MSARIDDWELLFEALEQSKREADKCFPLEPLKKPPEPGYEDASLAKELARSSGPSVTPPLPTGEAPIGWDD